MSEARVDMLDAATGEVVDHCYGPVLGGGCSRADRNGIVLCNGRRVAAPSAGPEYWLVWVPPASQHCPRAWKLDAIGY
jgi:hypothetical protein